MKTKRKKTPADYELYVFRIGGAEKSSLKKELEIVLKMARGTQSEGEYLKNRNDILTEAFTEGFKVLRRKYSGRAK